jgi:sialidase-1
MTASPIPSFLRPLVVVCFAIASVASAAEAEPIRADLFVAGTGDYHTYRIPSIIATPKGTVLAFCEGRKKNAADSGDIDLLVRRSTDGGKTWGPQEVVWDDGANVCGNPTPVVDADSGTIFLLLNWNRGEDTEQEIVTGKSKDTRRVFLSRSTDDGVTWSKPTDLTAAVKRPEWRTYANGPGNGIQLTRGPHRGRLVIPANHTGPGATSPAMSHSHVFYSDDHGATWHLGGEAEEGTNESTVAELADGSLLLNMRSYLGKNRRSVATSKDGGETWSAVRSDSALIEPVCQGSLIRFSWPVGGQPSRLLFSNPASKKREKLTVRLSSDEGATWSASRQLVAGPAAYSSLVALPGGDVGCLYEAGEKSPYEKIVLARFPVGWITGMDEEK